MDRKEFRVMLNLWMVSDPWPLSISEKTVFDEWLFLECRRHGYEDIPEAYHVEPNHGKGG